MNRHVSGVAVLDLEPAASDFLAEVIESLFSSPKTLPSKFFYDERGSDLFQQICELPEYYITRTEAEILRVHGAEMAASIGENAEIVGFGTGAGIKTRMLLDHLENPIAYVPVDISKQRLMDSAAALQREMPTLEILPVCADYLQPLQLPRSSRKPDHVAVYFPGSTIGNLEPPIAQDFLRRVCRLCGHSGGLVIGVDLQKSPEILEAAYNDSAGVTAAFNLNLLVRANRELGADFDIAQWHHRAIYNREIGRIEMHLLSAGQQTAHVGGEEFHFFPGEKIITEFSYKYHPGRFHCPCRHGRLPLFPRLDRSTETFRCLSLRSRGLISPRERAGRIARRQQTLRLRRRPPTDRSQFRAWSDHRAHRSERLRQIDHAAADHSPARTGQRQNQDRRRQRFVIEHHRISASRRLRHSGRWPLPAPDCARKYFADGASAEQTNRAR